jgi:hypothetical protein
MVDRPRKTLEQLTQDVLESGNINSISDADLDTLFNEVEGTSSTTTNPPAQVGNQAPASGSPGIPATGTPAPAYSGDVPPPQGNIGASDAETKVALAQQADEIRQLKELVETLRQPAIDPTTQRTDPNADPDDDIDDSMIIEKPKEMIKKIAQREAARTVILGLTHYDTQSRRERAIEQYKSTHPDFDSLRPAMAQVVRDFPQLNKDPNALSRIYELAKQRVTKQGEELRTSLGLNEMDSLRKEIQDLKAQSGLTIEQAKAKLLDEIKRRRSAQGTLSGSPAVSVDTRTIPSQRTVPQTEEDKIFDDMMASGPSKLSF